LVLGAGEDAKGFRVPDHPVARALLRHYGAVLAVTSANRGGEPPALSAGEAVAALGDAVAVVLDAGRSPGGVPSTVVRVSKARVDVLREGAIPAAAIKETAGRGGCEAP
jgi:L-threonylcarbamoyladenylate synthase